ncbi:MAG: head GIN domain-containing protein [Bacteroidales bacterium]
MKFSKRIMIFLTLALLSATLTEVFAQEAGNKNVVTEERELGFFKGIDIGGSVNAFIQKGEENAVKIETDENLQDNVTTVVNNEILEIKSKGIKNPTKLNAFITIKDLKNLKAGGASDVTGESLFEGDELMVQASGATSVKLDVDVEYLETAVSGASDLILSGRATVHKITVSGAGSLKAKSLVTDKATYSVSGAGDAFLNVTGELDGSLSGAGDVKFVGDPETNIKTQTQESTNETYRYYSKSYPDSTKVKIGGLNIEVYEDNDSVKVVIGNRELHVDDNGNVRLGRHKR